MQLISGTLHTTVAVASSSHQHTTTQHTAKGRMWQAAANCWKSPWRASIPGLLQPPSTSHNFQKADLVWPVSSRHFIPVERWMAVCLCGQQESNLWPYYPASRLQSRLFSVVMVNRFSTGQGRCAANLHKWHMASSDRCQCGGVQTMSHIVEASANQIWRWSASASLSW